MENYLTSKETAVRLKEAGFHTKIFHFMKTQWHIRLAAFKKYYGYTNADLATMSGNTLQSVKNISQGDVPGWLKFAIQVWEINHSRTRFEDVLDSFLNEKNLHLAHSETMSIIRPGWLVSDWDWRKEKEFETLSSAIKSARQR